ncbi:MAG: nucleotidyl transferase AbiEii/AbiGii toxin family protein [Thermaerobacter sp.]|nr:nucleotidyl transferase AbiEii/AbiGii toxin family protein [Thermaerobacter sp.]
MEALDSIDIGRFPQPRWTFGGGTALMLRYHHRVSRDIDIFEDRPEWLSVLSPRLNNTTDTFSRDYVEDTKYLKLALPEGEIDFIIAPLLTQPGAVQATLRGRKVAVETY